MTAALRWDLLATARSLTTPDDGRAPECLARDRPRPLLHTHMRAVALACIEEAAPLPDLDGDGGRSQRGVREQGGGAALDGCGVARGRRWLPSGAPPGGSVDACS